MSFKNIKKRAELLYVVLKLSLKPHSTSIIPTFSFWYAALIGLHAIPFFSFLYTNLIYLLICLPPFVVLGIIINYYKDFNNITLFEKNFHFNPTKDDYLDIPSFIVSEFFVTRFSFKLKLYGNIFSKFEGKRLALIIIKAPTIKISIKPKKQLDQKFHDDGEVFYLTQKYERNSSQVSFVIFVQADEAVDTKKLEFYIICESSLQKFLKDFSENPKIMPDMLISKEKFYLSTIN